LEIGPPVARFRWQRNSGSVPVYHGIAKYGMLLPDILVLRPRGGFFGIMSEGRHFDD
jgi:hypothetical protein